MGGQITCFLCSKELSNSNYVRKYPKILSKSPKLSQDHHRVTGLFKWFEFFCIKKIHETNFSIIIDKNIVGKLKFCRTIVFKSRQNGARSSELSLCLPTRLGAEFAPLASLGGQKPASGGRQVEGSSLRQAFFFGAADAHNLLREIFTYI